MENGTIVIPWRKIKIFKRIYRVQFLNIFQAFFGTNRKCYLTSIGYVILFAFCKKCKIKNE